MKCRQRSRPLVNLVTHHSGWNARVKLKRRQRCPPQSLVECAAKKGALEGVTSLNIGGWLKLYDFAKEHYGKPWEIDGIWGSKFWEQPICLDGSLVYCRVFGCKECDGTGAVDNMLQSLQLVADLLLCCCLPYFRKCSIQNSITINHHRAPLFITINHPYSLPSGNLT